MNLQKKKAFTLLEVLISITLLSLVLMALYRSVDILKASNKNLFHHLEKSSNIIKGANSLYLDILESNGRLKITHLKKYHRIEIESTKHSLYGLYRCKVIWLVYKENNTLLRLEGNNYNLPLKEEDNIAIDKITENMEIFNIYKNKKKNKILVVMKILNQEVQSFMIQNLDIQFRTYGKDEIHINIIGGINANKEKDKNTFILK